MHLQKKENIFDLTWSRNTNNLCDLTYGDIFHQNEVEQSKYNFEKSSTGLLLKNFENYETESSRLLAEKLSLPAYDCTLKAAHIFNLLDARGCLSVTERATFIKRIRTLSKEVGTIYLESREKLNFPLLK